MRETVENMLAEMQGMAFNRSYFHGDSRFSLGPEDYAISGFNRFSIGFSAPAGLIFDPGHNDYALVLTAPRKNKILNVAIIGFNVEDDVIDCTYIAGGRKRYRELAPVKWDKGLCSHLIDVAIEVGASALHLLPSYMIQASEKHHGAVKFAADKNDSAICGRLKSRYDAVAEFHKMRLDPQIHRYVMEL